MVKHLTVVAIVGLLSFMNIDNAHGQWGNWNWNQNSSNGSQSSTGTAFDGFFGSLFSMWGGSQGSANNFSSATDTLSQDMAAIETATTQFNKDLDNGNYAQAATDLNTMTTAQQNYYSDLQNVNSGNNSYYGWGGSSYNSGSNGSAVISTPIIVPVNAQGKL